MCEETEYPVVEYTDKWDVVLDFGEGHEQTVCWYLDLESAKSAVLSYYAQLYKDRKTAIKIRRRVKNRTPRSVNVCFEVDLEDWHHEFEA